LKTINFLTYTAKLVVAPRIVKQRFFVFTLFIFIYLFLYIKNTFFEIKACF